MEFPGKNAPSLREVMTRSLVGAPPLPPFPVIQAGQLIPVTEHQILKLTKMSDTSAKSWIERLQEMGPIIETRHRKRGWVVSRGRRAP